MRKALVTILVGLSLLAVQALGGAAHAAGTTAVPCSASALLSAITTANATPGADTLSLASGCTYTLTSANNGHNGLPVISSEITIAGNGATITRAASAPAFRIIAVAGAGSLDLESVAISNGFADSDCPQATSAVCGGAIANSGTLTVGSSTIAGNTVRVVPKGHCTEDIPACFAEGGAISNAGMATVANSEVSRNLVDAGGKAGNGLGGGLTNYGQLTIQSTSVADNRITASNSGAGGAIGANDHPVTIQDSSITDNSISAAGRFGGGAAIYIFNAPFLHISGSVVAGNSASGSEEAHGGIIIRRTQGSISHTLVEGNSATATGARGFSEAGGIDTLGAGASLTLTDSQVLGNKAVGSDGSVGGVAAAGAISGTVIRGNIVEATGSGSIASGGGLGVTGPLTLENSAVQDNQTVAPNGSAWSAGIHLFRGIGILTATGTSISGNSASGNDDAEGGGIFIRPGTSLTLDSSPVRGNSANGTTAFGGGIANQRGSADLTASPVMDNSAIGASAAGGGLFNDGGSFVLNSSPVLHNVPDNCYPLGSISGCTG